MDPPDSVLRKPLPSTGACIERKKIKNETFTKFARLSSSQVRNELKACGENERVSCCARICRR